MIQEVNDIKDEQCAAIDPAIKDAYQEVVDSIITASKSLDAVLDRLIKHEGDATCKYKTSDEYIKGRHPNA